MLNPSTADATLDDPTIRRCRSFAKAWSLGGLWVVNLYALRATDPRLLKDVEDPVGPENDDAIHDAIVRSRVTCLAWGAAGGRERVDRVLEILWETGRRPFCLGVTRGGHPRHPLRISSGTRLIPFAATPATTTRRGTPPGS